LFRAPPGGRGFRQRRMLKSAAVAKCFEGAVAKIRVKLGAAEAEVEADPEHLRETIDLVPALAAKLPSVSPPPQAVRPPDADSSDAAAPHAPLAQLPSIALEKSDSLADVIGKFFSDPWGRDRRKLSDVREALQSYGMNYPKQSVAVALLRLAKTSKLRRFKAEDGEFVYTASSPGLLAPLGVRTEPPVGEMAESSPN